MSVRDCASWRAGRRRTAALVGVACVSLVVLRRGCRPRAESARLLLLVVLRGADGCDRSAGRARLLVLLLLRCGVGCGRNPNADRAESLVAVLAWLLELANPKARSADEWDPPSVLLRRRAPAGRIGSSTRCESHSSMISCGGGFGLGFSHW